jgi:hypothetical protein
MKPLHTDVVSHGIHTFLEPHRQVTAASHLEAHL